MATAWSSYSSLKGRPKPDKEVCTQSTAIFSRECLPLVEKGAQRLFFKQFVSRRPQKLKTTGPFYLSIETNRRPDDNVWFKVQPMVENKINDMMRSIVADTILESSDKKFTNHSARKTVVSKLKKANVERSGVGKVTGHKNIQSLDDYDEANEDEQRQLSYAISWRNNINPQPPVSREVHSRQEPLASSAQKPISMPNSAAFG